MYAKQNNLKNKSFLGGLDKRECKAASQEKKMSMTRVLSNQTNIQKERKTVFEDWKSPGKTTELFARLTAQSDDNICAL